MKILHLSHPLALLFLLLPLLATVFLIVSRFIVKRGVRITGVSKFYNLLSIKKIGFVLSTIIILLGMFIIAFSFTNPQYGTKQEKITSQGIDIMIALDNSGSMSTKDSSGSARIEAAKRVIGNFIDKRTGDRVGLITFSDSSLIRCPATLKSEIIKKIVSRVRVTTDRTSGTAIGVGLASAINRLLKINKNDTSKSQIVILVTDGINNSGEISPETAAKLAKENNIRVYTIGIGKRKDIDIDILQAIADKTNGDFFYSKNTQQLNLIFEEINKLEKHKIETIEYIRFNSVGYKYAIIGIVLLLLGLLINSLFFKRLA